MIPPRAVARLTVALPLALLGCGQSALGLMPGVINDPHNRSLRRSILDKGMDRACAEVRGRSLPIRARDDLPTIGRFLPLGCSARTAPTGELYLQLGGLGYVWTSMSQRVGFEANAGLAYDTDFLLDGSTMYVYFRPRGWTGSGFQTRVVENPQAAYFAGMVQAPGGQKLTDAFGSRIMQGELARGFTVIRKADGSVEMGLGVLPPGTHPPGGISTLEPGKPVIVNDRSELRPNQRDFVPLEVPPETRKVTIHAGVEGAPAVDVLVVPRAMGDHWLGAYATQATTTPPPGPPLLDDAVATGQPWSRTLELSPGAYYLVLDNTSTAGRSGAGGTPERPVVVSYGVQLE